MNNECECKLWATDRMDLMAFGNGHHHNCPQYVEGKPRHVYQIHDGAARHWFVATSADEARELWKQWVLDIGGDDPDGSEKVEQLPDDKELTVGEDGSDERTTNACAWWAMQAAPGLLGTTEW